MRPVSPTTSTLLYEDASGLQLTPLERGTGSHLDYPLGTQFGMKDARSIESTSKPTGKNKPVRIFHHWCRKRFCELDNITLEGVKNSSEVSGATPRGRSRAPTKIRP